MNELDTAARQSRAKVRMIAAHEKLFGVLSTGERIAVAGVLDRPRTEAALRVHRDRWEEHPD